MMQIILVVLMVRLMIVCWPAASVWLQNKWQQLLTMLQKRKQAGLFDEFL